MEPKLDILDLFVLPPTLVNHLRQQVFDCLTTTTISFKVQLTSYQSIRLIDLKTILMLCGSELQPDNFQQCNKLSEAHCPERQAVYEVESSTSFYHALVVSVLSFALPAWFGNLSLKNKGSLNQIVKWPSRLIGEPQLNFVTLYARQL